MDWPISWQKVKDNGSGYEILDPADYGLGLDKGALTSVQGTLMLDDMALAIKSGKSIVLRVALGAKFGLDVEAVLLPAISYGFDKNGDLIEVVCYTRMIVQQTFVDMHGRFYRSSDGKSTTSMYQPSLTIPEAQVGLEAHYVLTSWDGTMSWELGDHLIDLSSVAVTTGTSTNIEGLDAETLNEYSSRGKSLTAKFKFIDPTDSANEIIQVVGLNLKVTNHTTSGATTMAYTASVGGMFFSIYKEGSSWKYTVSQQS